MPASLFRTWWRDVALALLLAAVLTLAWCLTDWRALSRLRLPDTDDMLRLQQIRDWLDGQAFGDLAQHRLGTAGLEMHWSRLPDLVPGAIIAGLTPLIGRHSAELAGVIAWPALLFVAALGLSGAIARRLTVSAPVTIVVAALAYPASSLFVPGRIDHHGLQLVLLLVLAHAVLSKPSWVAGAIAGAASAASLAVGMETAPLLAIGGGVIALRWLRGEAGLQPLLASYGGALAGSLVLAALMLRTSGWSFPACDGFGVQLWRAAQLAALVPLALGAMGHRLPTMRVRLGAALVLAGAAGVAIMLVSPACLSPYGGVDPLLARIWLANVAEAQPLFGAPPVHALGYAGLAIVGAAASGWMWRRSHDHGWLILAVFQIGSFAITLVQLRGAYAGAMLAAPALAGLIALARERGVVPLALAWIASAGIVYPMAAARLLADQPATTTTTAPGCDRAPALALLAMQPRGTLVMPIDFGAQALAATPHTVLAAPYHRNRAGIRAVYRLMLLPEPRAAVWARRLGADYLAICPADFAELGEPPAGSLLAELRRGAPPAWLRLLTPPTAGMAVYRIEAGR